MRNEDIYDLVPGKGKVLEDGTWWTDSDAIVGEICTTPYYYRKIQGNKWWASDKRSQCVETAIFGGHIFARWKDLESTAYKPCILYTNQSLQYEHQ